MLREGRGCRTMTEYFGTMKVVILGDCGVGKSWLLDQFLERESLTSAPTNGVDFGTGSLNDQEGRLYKINSFELSGRIHWHGFVANLVSGCSGVLIVFDLTSEKTLTNALEYWLVIAWRHKQVKEVPVILVGNKCDCSAQREVSRERMRILCDEMDLMYIEVSAKEKLNVSLLFVKLLAEAKAFNRLELQNKSVQVK